MKKPEQVPEKGLYYHYKHRADGPVNNYAYEVLGVGCHTEQDENFVVYRPLYEGAFVYQAGKLFDLRPLEMFMKPVIIAETITARFTKITDLGLIAQLEAIRDQLYS